MLFPGRGGESIYGGKFPGYYSYVEICGSCKICLLAISDCPVKLLLKFSSIPSFVLQMKTSG
jgi:hypothetical protein